MFFPELGKGNENCIPSLQAVAGLSRKDPEGLQHRTPTTPAGLLVEEKKNPEQMKEDEEELGQSNNPLSSISSQNPPILYFLLKKWVALM